VQQRAFLKLQHFFIKSMKDRNVCCCVYHVEVQLLKDAMNRMRDRRLGIHRTHECGSFCFCDVCCPPGTRGVDGCQAHSANFARTTKLWQSCVCAKDELQLWHRRECLMGECDVCGVERKLLFCPSKVDPELEDIISWCRFQRVEIGQDNEGKPIKQVREVHVQTSPVELVLYLKPISQRFLLHNYVAHWQDEQAKMAMQSLRKGVILSHIDFSENYRFEPQNELQLEYYDSVNVTILVHITHRTVIDPETGVERIVKESHFYVSDDKKHDTLFLLCLQISGNDKGMPDALVVLWNCAWKG
jgi:hypothetical protein